MAALLAGCGGGVDQGTAASNAKRALESIKSQRSELGPLENQLVDRCLDSKGFTVHPPSPPVTDDVAPRNNKDLVAPSIQFAKTKGYGSDPRDRRKPDDQPARTAEERAYDALPQRTRDAMGVALFGDDSKMISVEINGDTVATGSTGCLTEVRTRLYGSIKEYLRFSEIAANQINNLSSTGVTQDPSWVAEQKKWSQCMATAGFAGVPETQAAQKKARDQYDALPHAQARRFEIGIATADATCAANLKLQASYDAAYVKANKKALADNESDLIAWSELVVQAVKRARVALGTAK
jgi:hypothetical protein